MKIGIITYYYQSLNYGGNLQAYALPKVINKYGLSSEQINCEFSDFLPNQKSSFFEKIKKYTFLQLFKKIIKIPFKIIKKIYINIKNKSIHLYDNKNAINNFNINIIPHSKEIYSFKDIKNSVINYDFFITGSDQVWNPSWYFPPFFLDFVTYDKIKISYAASLGKNFLKQEQKDIFKKHLTDFKAVSVREEDSIELIQDVCPVPVVYTLDPTLLLSKNDWDEICFDRIVNEKYIFCYFLGENKKQRKLATEYAKKHNLKLVNIPYLHGYYRSCDKKFADIKLHDIGPEKFISLIKYAELVFTDSFHATVFSGIYEKNYITFHRDGAKGMSSRIYTLTSLYETKERFCDCEEKETLAYIESLKPIDYTRKLSKLEKKRKESIDFLINNLK